MEAHYSTLRILYLLVKDSPHPTQYACRPAEIITRHDQPWDIILSHLEELGKQGFILYTTPSLITITQKGMEYMESGSVNETTPISISEKVA